jgi:2-phosphoglycerate kinase
MKLILIGGVPRTGKTTLAKQIATDLGISWMSTDTLESIAHSYTPEEQKDVRFPKSVMRRNTNRSNDEFYSTYSILEIIDAYEKQAETVGAAIETLAEYADKEDWGYVIEGYHVTPSLLAKLREIGITFTSVVLVNSDPAQAIERSRQSDVKSDWVRDNTQNDETYAKIAEGIQEHSQRLVEASKENEITCIDMSEDFEEKVVEVHKLLTQAN